MMSEDDEIERLLREVNALEHRRPENRPDSEGRDGVEHVHGSGQGRSRGSWVAVNAAGGAAAGFLLGILPFISSPSAAVGAALGAALAALVGGPPGWFSSTSASRDEPGTRP